MILIYAFNYIMQEFFYYEGRERADDEDDSGGETNMGISKTTHKKEDIKNMTRERANAIFYRDYYKWNGLSNSLYFFIVLYYAKKKNTDLEYYQYDKYVF